MLATASFAPVRPARPVLVRFEERRSRTTEWSWVWHKGPADEMRRLAALATLAGLPVAWKHRDADAPLWEVEILADGDALERLDAALDAEGAVAAVLSEPRWARYEPAAINAGLCEPFAGAVVSRLRGATLRCEQADGATDGALCHWFAEYRGRFYDAECPAGTDDWKRLPFYGRAARIMAAGSRP